MPHTATPVIKPADLRKGDILPSGATVLDRPTIVQRGKAKGHVAIETGGGRLVIEPDTAVYVEREVPTVEERATYITAYGRFNALVETVQAKSALDRAVGELEDAIATLKCDPLRAGSRSALRHEPGEVESAAAAFRTTWGFHAEVLYEDGFTMETVNELAKHGRMSTGLFQYAPKHMPNDDCHLDGTPAKRGIDRVAPAYAQEG